jgi:hypothetical protein
MVAGQPPFDAIDQFLITMPKPVRSRIKACETCKAVSSTLYRVVQDDTDAWTLICQACRIQVERHPSYRYGGTWKADKRH